MDWHLCYGPDSQSLLPSNQRPAASLKVMLRTIVFTIWSYYEATAGCLYAYALSALFWQLLADPLTLAHHHSLNFGEISTANPSNWYWTSDPLCSGDEHHCSIIQSHLQSDSFQESLCTDASLPWLQRGFLWISACPQGKPVQLHQHKHDAAARRNPSNGWDAATTSSNTLLKITVRPKLWRTRKVWNSPMTGSQQRQQ